MRLDGIKITIGIDTIRNWFCKKNKDRVRVGEVLDIKGFKYRVFEINDDGFNVKEEKDDNGMADKH